MKQNLIDLDLVLKQLAKGNLKVSFTKCILAQAKVKMLSRLMPTKDQAKSSQGGIYHPDEAAYGRRRDLIDMGSIIFYGGFITELIRALTRQKAVFNWSPACVAAFKHFKEALMSESILKLPFWENLFEPRPTPAPPGREPPGRSLKRMVGCHSFMPLKRRY